MRSSFALLLFATLLFTACKQATPLVPTDLLSYGLSLKINAPANATVNFNDLGIMKDVTVNDSAGFNIQIFESEAQLLDSKKVIEVLKAETQAKDVFSKFIQEDETGFIFEKKIGEDYINYDFRHIKINGDRQYLFQSAIAQTFTLDQVKLMYKAVQD